MANTDHLKKLTITKSSSIFYENFVLLENQIHVFYHFTFKIFLIKFNLILELSLVSSYENLETLFYIDIPKTLFP